MKRTEQPLCQFQNVALRVFEEDAKSVGGECVFLKSRDSVTAV